MKLTTATYLIFICGATDASSRGAGMVPSNRHHPDVVMSKFGGHLRCPYAREWMSKGAEAAARDLGILPEETTATGARDLEEEEEEEGGGKKPAWVGGNGDGDGVPPSRCALAPGPIGGAHQDGYSDGYDFACPGAPGEASPYQWPLRWAANYEGGSILYQTDDVIYRNGGRVYYRLDRNWKRNDFYYQRGYQRSIVQGPCREQVDEEGEVRCIKDTTNPATVIHRGSKMYFIDWSNTTTLSPDGAVDVAEITSCSVIDLSVIGNVRPDWFMDSRGSSVDVQYLGNQHIYYPTGATTDGGSGAPTVPRLVKQWRKKDFADHYFTMSMQANPGPDGVHWPLVINVPGEGFGDDKIRHYYDHTLLAEDDDEDIFLLDEAYVAAGGECSPVERPGGGEGEGEGEEGGGGGGPPGLDEPFPSDLEVDENAWYSNVYTFSPVWEPPPEDDEADKCTENGGGGGEPFSGMATTEAGPHTIVESCFDASTGEVKMAVVFDGIVGVEEDDDDAPLPWLALGFRKAGERCLMTPADGSDGEVIIITGSEGDASVPAATFGPLPSSARRFDDGAFDALGSLPPLDEADGFGEVEVTRADGVVKLRFRRAMGVSGESLGDEPVLSKMVEGGGGGGGNGGNGGGRSGGGGGGIFPTPEAMHLSYAYGSTPAIGYHTSRGCFEVVDFPACPVAVDDTAEEAARGGNGMDEEQEEGTERGNEAGGETKDAAGTLNMRSGAGNAFDAFSYALVTVAVIVASTVA